MSQYTPQFWRDERLPLIEARAVEDGCKLCHALHSQSLTLEAICQAAALSPSDLIRAFKKRYGMTPHAYLVNQRVQHAQRLLKWGFSMTAAASESGFADQTGLVSSS